MAPAKPSTSLTVKLLKDVIAPSAYDVTDGGFPGPLFNDQGPGGATSVLQTAGAALKAKKTALIQWLEGRIAEIEGGLMYIGTTGPIGGGTAKAEGKVVLMKLLKIWVENDGKLSGSPAIEEAIRTALLGSRSDVSSSVGETSALGYQYALGNGPTSFYTGDGQGMSKPDAVTATYQTKTSSLDKIQEHLLHGERKKAYQLALDERLWAHALLIARGLDEESWTEAAHEFIKIELSSQGVGYDPQQPFSSDGRESLRVAYGLFAGDGPSALKLLVPPARFGVNSLQSHSRVSSSHASISPDAPTTEATSVPEETWAQWRKLLAATIANQSPNNTAATTALGDYLLANNWVEAAHSIYLH
ncbi:Protein transport protein Sec16A [Serendipita sp. 411]|nr:Protein transport protein Sec16A [Serendipita sp. 411]